MPGTSPPIRHSVNVEDSIIAAGRVQLNTLIERLELPKAPPEAPFDPFAMPTCKLAECTKREYKYKWTEMMKFFYLIGDYQSAMLVDRENCPVNPLPFKPSSLALYLNYRCGIPGSALCDEKGLPKTDINNNPILILGGLNSPSALYSIRSAVNFLHETAYPQTCAGPYKSNCPDCEALNLSLGNQIQGENEHSSWGAHHSSPPNTTPYPMPQQQDPEHTAEEEIAAMDFQDEDFLEAEDANLRGSISHSLGIFRSCIAHANNPHLRSSGNVLYHPQVKHHYSGWLKQLSRTHVVRGCGQLYPSEIRAIRDYLLARGDPVSLRTLVMIILGINLFLRADEIVTLSMEDFVDSYYPKGKKNMNGPGNGKDVLKRFQVLHKNNVEALCVEIQGKSDHTPVRLILFSNDEYPEFCPVRHLLWYLKVFRIKGGYIFPEDKSLITFWEDGRRHDWSPDKRIAYTPFLRLVSSLVQDVCKRDISMFTVGTHICRKTAYLFAVWGFMNGLSLGSYSNFLIPHMYLAQIMRSARHSTVNNANTYQRDSSTIFELVKRERSDANNRVGVFQSIFLEPGTYGSGLTPSAQWQRPLPELVDWWYTDCVCMDTSRLVRPVELLHFVCHIKPKLTGGIDGYKQEIQKHIKDHSIVDDLIKKLGELLIETVKKETNAIQQLLEEKRTNTNETTLALNTTDGGPGSSIIANHKSITKNCKQPASGAQQGRTAMATPLIRLDRALPPKCKGVAKIAFLHRVRDQFNEQAEGKLCMLHPACSRWYRRNVKTVLHCLDVCLHGSTSKFVDVYGEKFTTTNWECRCNWEEHRSNVVPT